MSENSGTGESSVLDASPQLENGYTRIANEIIEALMRTNLSAYQGRVLWAIWRETYGYHKTQDWLSNNQLAEMTGLEKAHVSRTVSELRVRNIVTRIGNKIGFNKHYQQWKELPKRVTVTNRGKKVTDWGYRSYQSGGPQKKKYKKKDITPSPSVQILIDYFFHAVEALREFKPEITGSRDGAIAKSYLAKHALEDGKAQIDFFLTTDKSQKYLSLSAALSADTYNAFMSAKNAAAQKPLGGLAY